VCGASLGGSTAFLTDGAHPNEHEYPLVVDVEEALRLEVNRPGPGSFVDEAPHSVSAPEHRSIAVYRREVKIRRQAQCAPQRC